MVFISHFDSFQREQEHFKQLNLKISKEKEELESYSSSRVVKAKQELEINSELKQQIEAQERKVKNLEDELEALKKAKSHEKEMERVQEKGRNEMIDLEQRPFSKRSLIPTPPTSADRRIGYTNRFRRTTSASRYSILI